MKNNFDLPHRLLIFLSVILFFSCASKKNETDGDELEAIEMNDSTTQSSGASKDLFSDWAGEYKYPGGDKLILTSEGNNLIAFDSQGKKEDFEIINGNVFIDGVQAYLTDEGISYSMYGSGGEMIVNLKRITKENEEGSEVYSATAEYPKISLSDLPEQFNKNDLKKLGLLGRVKSVHAVTKTKDQNTELIINRSFDTYGNQTKIKQQGGEYDELKESLDLINPYYMDDETFPLVSPRGASESPNKYFKEGGFNTEEGGVNFVYEGDKVTEISGFSNDGWLVWKFTYNDAGEMITKDVYDRGAFAIKSPGSLYSKFKYKWADVGGKKQLVSRILYTPDGNEVYNQTISYSEEGIVINAILEYRTPLRVTIIPDQQGRIISKKIEEKHNQPYQHITDYTYTYNEAGVVQVLKDERFFQDLKWQVQPTQQFDITRDSHGQITSLRSRYLNRQEDNNYRLWSYKYDHNNNWIERVEYTIVKKDIEIKTMEKVITREFIYY